MLLKKLFITYRKYANNRIIIITLVPDLSSKINDQLGSTYKKDIPWKEQLRWGLLISNTSLPKPAPIINKLDYE